MSFCRKLKNDSILKQILVVGLFVILSYLYIAIPLHKGVIYHGPDRMFHLERLEEAYQTLKNGHVVSMISTYSSSRVGQAINTFYPWINLIPYGIIRMIVSKPITAYYLFMMLEQFLGLMIAYTCSLRLIKSKKASILFAVLYRFSVYILINDFARVDIGEAWATIFLPVVFLGSYIIFTVNRKASYIQGTIFLALGLIFITYCHILTTVITVGLLAIVYVVSFYFQQNKLNKFGAFFASACMYFLGGSIILFPMIDTMCKLKIVTPNPEYFTNYNFTFNVLFNKSLENILDFDNPNIGIVILALMLLGVLFFKNSNVYHRAVYILGVSIVAISTTIFPWKLFNNTFIKVIQFPWRMLPIGILLIVFYFASQKEIRNLKIPSFILLCGVFVTIGISSEINFMASQNPEVVSTEEDYAAPYGKLLDNNSYNKSMSRYHDNSWAAAYVDYLPQSSKNFKDDIFHHIMYINDEKQEISYKDINSIYQGLEYHLTLGHKNNRVVLPFVIYDKNNYNLYINNVKQKILVKDGRLMFKYQNSGKLSVKIQYKTPLSYKLTRILSVVVVVGMILFLVGYNMCTKKTEWEYENKK